MSNKPHLRPHKKRRQASRNVRLLVAILFLAIFALAVALAVSGRYVPAGRLPLLRRGSSAVDGDSGHPGGTSLPQYFSCPPVTAKYRSRPSHRAPGRSCAELLKYPPMTRAALLHPGSWSW